MLARHGENALNLGLGVAGRYQADSRFACRWTRPSSSRCDDSPAGVRYRRLEANGERPAIFGASALTRSAGRLSRCRSSSPATPDPFREWLDTRSSVWDENPPELSDKIAARSDRRGTRERVRAAPRRWCCPWRHRSWRRAQRTITPGAKIDEHPRDRSGPRGVCRQELGLRLGQRLRHRDTRTRRALRGASVVIVHHANKSARTKTAEAEDSYSRAPSALSDASARPHWLTSAADATA